MEISLILAEQIVQLFLILLMGYIIVKAKLLRNPRYFIGCQHNAKTEKHISRKGQKFEEQQGCLHKCS